MKTLVGKIGFVVALAMPAMASAQGKMSDADYCKALGDKYKTYFSNMQSGRSPMPEPADVQVAMEQCKAGNTAAGIPVLEQRLKNGKVDLPPRG
jgi:predicted lipid-binding transport protein (Tim44 family)